MAVVALLSAKGSPGVTTAALALTLAWGGRCVLAECDPAGGSIQAGYLAGALPADRGIRELAVAELRGEPIRDHWWAQLVDLWQQRRERLLLPGITDPAQAGTLRPVWDRLAAFFAGLEYADPPYDVIADCGRLAVADPPWPVLYRADAVLLVMRATLPGMSAALPAIRALKAQLTEHATGASALGLLLTGAGDQPARVVAHHLQTPVVAQLPDDQRSAHVFSHGGSVRMNAPLLRAAAGAYQAIANHVRARRATLGQPGATPQAVPHG